jgi:PAS domain S-box-containing protein
MPRCIVLGILAIVLGGAAAPAQSLTDSTGQSLEIRTPPDTLSVQVARRDQDGDLVPDRIGDTVTVRGRASVGKGGLPDPRLVFMQDGTAGIAVRLPEAATVLRGDSLRVTGVLRHQHGLTRLHAWEVARPGTMSRVPDPVPLTVAAARSETYEGQLVQIRGRVAARRTNEGGRYLLLEDRAADATARLAAFVPARRQDEVPLSAFEAGDEIKITGILAQYDDTAPYDASYQVLPRDRDDLSGAGGFLSTYYQVIIILFVAGGILGGVVVFTLRAIVRRRTEQLAESRARFRRLAEATFEGIILHDDGTILDVNRALTRMTGHDRGALVGRSFRDVLSESTRDLERDTDRPDAPYEAVVVRTDGSSFPAEIEEKAVDARGRRVRVAAIRDVTDRKKREREILRAKEKAEQAARLKSSLLNNMSHELRTPITSIIGYADLIQNEPDADHGSFAARIRESGQRLFRTLQAVLEMAQLESGTLDAEPTEVNVRGLVREVVEEHRPMAEQDELTLTTETDGAREPLYTDPTLVRRVLSNLVHNAIKFTEGGEVHVRVALDEAGVTIAVADTGIGIAPSFREHLFEPFKQASEGPARTHEGTGLGLALTKRMVDLLGGDIDVESEKGEGTTVVVSLPPEMPGEPAMEPEVP